MASPELKPTVEHRIQRLSQSVFVGLCRLVGTKQQLAIRRDVADILEILIKEVKTIEEDSVLFTGSNREGFRMEGSDIDTMYWPNNHRVIWNESQVSLYPTRPQAILISDDSDSPPGYTLLQLPTPIACKEVLSSRVTIDGSEKIFVSSFKYRQNMCSFIRPNSIIHGPSGSGIVGTLEYDDVHGFFSDFWPPPASGWIDRCRQQSWPLPLLLYDIIGSGSHVVPIAHRLGNHEENEWRISFASAERKLVLSLNHCQFLTYGLLKLFLKEVINKGLKDEEKVLSSYHIKTCVFWVVQQSNRLSWCPQNLLQCFWACFKLILKWVYNGECPNFFVPDNNMFLTKIYGAKQQELFTRLYELYGKGMLCMLECLSVGHLISSVLENPECLINADENAIISKTELSVELVKEIDIKDSLPLSKPYKCIRYLTIIERLTSIPFLTQNHAIFLQKITTSVLKHTAFILFNSCTDGNKASYLVDKIAIRWLKIVSRFGFIFEMLYLALYLYKTCRYDEAFEIIETTKAKLSNPLKYRKQSRHIDTEVLHQAAVVDMKLNSSICYLNELMIEKLLCQHSKKMLLQVPSFVL